MFLNLVSKPKSIIGILWISGSKQGKCCLCLIKLGQLNLSNFVARITASAPFPSGNSFGTWLFECWVNFLLRKTKSQCFHGWKTLSVSHTFRGNIEVLFGGQSTVSVMIRFGSKTGGGAVRFSKQLKQIFDASTWAQNKGNAQTFLEKKFDNSFKAGNAVSFSLTNGGRIWCFGFQIQHRADALIGFDAALLGEMSVLSAKPQREQFVFPTQGEMLSVCLRES